MCDDSQEKGFGCLGLHLSINSTPLLPGLSPVAEADWDNRDSIHLACTSGSSFANYPRHWKHPSSQLTVTTKDCLISVVWH